MRSLHPCSKAIFTAEALFCVVVAFACVAANSIYLRVKCSAEHSLSLTCHYACVIFALSHFAVFFLLLLPLTTNTIKKFSSLDFTRISGEKNEISPPIEENLFTTFNSSLVGVQFGLVASSFDSQPFHSTILSTSARMTSEK